MNIEYSHYKERNPEETIKIIKNFFTNKNIIIKEIIENTEADSWYTVVELYFKEYLILTSYGKGVTKNYARASGLAEAYERFCCNLLHQSNVFIEECFLKLKYKKDNFYYDKNEKIVNFNNLSDSINILKHHLYNFSKEEDIDNINDYYKTIYNDCFIEIPYFNPWNSEEKLFIDPRFLFSLKGSSGMAAGNTLEEALNQGISEIFEHFILDKYFKDFSYLSQYSLDLTLIENLKIKNMIQNIEKNGNKLYIIDCSYYYNMPVLMSILINYNMHTCFVDFGSFPVFEIALERVITEIYQGNISYNDLDDNIITRPFRNEDWCLLASEHGGCITKADWFNENILLKMIEKCKPNSEIFLFQNDINYSNKEILLYYKELSQKYKYNFYYHNFSLIENMYAIQIYSNLSETLTSIKENLLKTQSVKDNYNFLIKQYNIEKKLLNNNIIDINELFIHYLEFKKLNTVIQLNMVLQNHCSFNLFFERTEIYKLLLVLLFEQDIDNLNFFDDFKSSCYGDNIKKYLLLFRYKKFNKYSYEEIKKIFKILGFKDEITLEEYENICNKEFFVKKGFIDFYYNTFWSKNYQEYIKLFI